MMKLHAIYLTVLIFAAFPLNPLSAQSGWRAIDPGLWLHESSARRTAPAKVAVWQRAFASTPDYSRIFTVVSLVEIDCATRQKRTHFTDYYRDSVYTGSRIREVSTLEWTAAVGLDSATAQVACTELLTTSKRDSIVERSIAKAATRWYLVGGSPTGDVDNYFVDRGTFVKSDNIVHGWLKTKVVSLEGADSGAGVRLSLYDVDCRSNRIRLQQFTLYEAGGATIPTPKLGVQDWESVIPESIGEAFTAAFCAPAPLPPNFSSSAIGPSPF